ncbi:hypothetical protein chiPu_0027261 [Chiloscyllium punctatum]|uniref:Uncharacterized protein n=1 Tax=Chiloscyllium punctatum TaxID=137246 RepID=A0A401TJW3_CHIPU|nr:hypothetical protein [Chiloscyllium punctatum]
MGLAAPGPNPRPPVTGGAGKVAIPSRNPALTWRRRRRPCSRSSAAEPKQRQRATREVVAQHRLEEPSKSNGLTPGNRREKNN